MGGNSWKTVKIYNSFYAPHSRRQSALGCTFRPAQAFLLAEHFPVSNVSAVLLGILVGILATSRVIFIFLPAYCAFISYRRFGRATIYYGLTGTVVAICFHFIGYLTSEYCQPFHVLGRGNANIPPWVMIIGALTSAAVLFLAHKRVQGNFQSRLFWLSWMVMVPMLFISIGELIGGNFNMPKWEAAHYLLPAWPLLVFATYENRKGNVALDTGIEDAN